MMNKMILILALIFMGCEGTTSIASIEQLEQSSSSMQLAPASSLQLRPPSLSIEHSSSSSSSSLAIEHSSSSSHINQSSSSIGSSSSVYSSSSSLYKSSIYLFDIDSASGLEFYKVNEANKSHNYEIIGNIIKNYHSQYNLDGLSVGSVTVNGDVEIRKFNTTTAWIRDLKSVEQIEIIGDMVRIVKPNETIVYPFTASATRFIGGKNTFVLHRKVGGDYICFVHNISNAKWEAVGFSGMPRDPAFMNACGAVNDYKFW